MTSIWFISPAWKRYEISRITFAQRAWALARMRERGVAAEACVIADDENLDLAREHGFATVERPNEVTRGRHVVEALGAKFNDGYLFAASEGVDYVCPIGSDSWLDPAFILRYITSPFAKLDHEVIYSRHYAVVRPDGKRRAQLLVTYEGGTTMFYPTGALKACGYKPIPDEAKRGCDGHTIASIKAGGEPKFVVCENHTLETVSFQSELQVTNYDALIDRWGVGETDKPFAGLHDHYPETLVQQVRKFYRDRATSK